VGLYSQATNHASVKVAHCSGVLSFWGTAGDEVGGGAGGCCINPGFYQLHFKRWMAAVGEDVGVISVSSKLICSIRL